MTKIEKIARLKDNILESKKELRKLGVQVH